MPFFTPKKCKKNSTDLPKLEEAEVWLCEIRKRLSSKEEGWCRREEREEERGGAGWVEEEGRGYK